MLVGADDVGGRVGKGHVMAAVDMIDDCAPRRSRSLGRGAVAGDPPPGNDLVRSMSTELSPTSASPTAASTSAP
jgi:hypothetical protein